MSAKAKLRLATLAVGITLPDGSPKRNEFVIGINPVTKSFYFENKAPEYLTTDDLAYLGTVVEKAAEFYLALNNV